MTTKEIAQLVYVVKAAYPKTYEHFTNKDFENLILAWQMVLEDYTYQQAAAGLKTYLASDTKGFPPSPGQVVDCIHKVIKPQTGELTGLEAWALVRRAIANSNYNAEAEFERLPAAVQRAVGSPANLREMAVLDIEQVETVEQSHFIRNYEGMIKRIADEAKIPASVMDLIRSTDQRLVQEKQGALPGGVA